VSLGAFSHVASATVTYNGFSDTTGLTLNGAAKTAITNDGVVLRLTPAVASRAGSAFSTAKVDTANFSSVFSFRITSPGGPLFDGNTANGADGFVFTVENQANNVGSAGQGIGFQGITPSVGIAYDTWKNPEHSDPSQNYVGIDLNGSVDHGLANGPTVNITSDAMANGNRWWSWVIYNGTILDVYLLENESTTIPPLPDLPILSYPLALATKLNASQAFAGFTSATGSDWEKHDILYWQYTPADIRSVPEPSTLALITLAAFAMARRPTHRGSKSVRRGRIG
jgi:hypothetical protein